MEKYERYRRFKFSKVFDSRMNAVTFDNLYICYNGGDFENVRIVHHRTDNALVIHRYNPTILSSYIGLNSITVNSQVQGEVVLSGVFGEIRIIFSTPEQKLFFLKEIQSDSSSSGSSSSDSGNNSDI
ncbi:hypothetical protein QE152_g27585 [Popillia japonica]|uniref:Uncharacterized protein n=1 Tax=Popillia japonica TaxID=7064 RepID=A0AAW1JUQ8_POPJA